MAGERMFPSPYREISAVCTDDHTAARDSRPASSAISSPASRREARHRSSTLRDDNTNAIRLYEHLGFTHSNAFAVTGYRAPA